MSIAAVMAAAWLLVPWDAARAQGNPLDSMLVAIMPAPGIVIQPFPGSANEISPYLEDWFSKRAVRVPVFVNVNTSFQPQTVNIVSLAKIVDGQGTIIAESNRNIATKFFRIFLPNMEFMFDIQSQDLNFMAEGPTEGALVFTPPYTKSSRLPGGTYFLIVTLWRFEQGRGLTEQISEPFSEQFTLSDESQDLLLTVLVNEQSPYFSDWQRNTNPAQVDVVNVFQRAHEVYMDARIDKDGQRVAYTKDGVWRQLGLDPILIPAISNFTIPGRQIPFFDPNLSSAKRDQLIGLEGAGIEARLNGALPEGDYQLCIQLRNKSDDHISGEYQCCDPFHLQLPPPPELMQPGDNEHTDPIPTMQWTHSVQPALTPKIRYTLQIMEVPESGEVTPDIFTRLDRQKDIEYTGIAGLSQPIKQAELPRLKQGKRYAWRVIASTPNEIPPYRFQNEGCSEVWTFLFGPEPIPAPKLEIPVDMAEVTLPETLFWSAVELRNGSPAHYVLKIKEAPGTGDVPDDFLEASQDALKTTVTARTFNLPGSPFTILTGHRYAWQVRAFDPTGVEKTFENGGLSEVWTFTAGEGSDSTMNQAVMLSYPANGDRLPDAKPPFVFEAFIDRSVKQNLTMTIQEVDKPGGATVGAERRFSGDFMLPESGPILLLNRYGAGGIVPSGQPLFGSESWVPVHGKSYRWTVAIRPADSAKGTRSNTADFTAAPRASELSPAEDRIVDAKEAKMSYVVGRPYIGRDAESGTSTTGFAPGDLPPETGPHFVMNPIVRRISALDTQIVFQSHTALAFEQGSAVAQYSFDMPLLAKGKYRWIVNTKYDEEILAVSEQATFEVGETNPCTSPCICVNCEFPIVKPGSPLISYAVPPRFAISFQPQIDTAAVTEGTVRVWVRQGTEAEQVTAARDPYFTGTFRSLTRHAASGERVIYDIDPRDSSGTPISLQPHTQYMWDVTVRFDPARIHKDESACPPNITEAGSLNAFFGTMLVPDSLPPCNAPVTNRTHPADTRTVADNLRIGGYTLQLDRANCAFRDSGRISGTGRIETRFGTWAVQFTDLEVNTTNEVIGGKAEAQTRSDLPISSATLQAATLSADQVRSITQLWHAGGTLLETVTGDRKVPCGITFDLDFLGASGTSPWGFRVACAKFVFEPTRASFDLVVGVRVPVETTQGESTQWIGLYGQGFPVCVAEGTPWLAAIRYLEDNQFGSPALSDWDFFVKHSEPVAITPQYRLKPGDGTALLISDRGFEQLHIEVGAHIPRSILIPQRDSSGVFVDVPESEQTRVALNGTFDFSRGLRAINSQGQLPPDALSGGFYLIADLPHSRISGKAIEVTAREITLDFSTTWSPHVAAHTAYTLPGHPAVPTQGAPFDLQPSWQGLFIKEMTAFFAALGTPIGVTNAFTSSPLSFTAFAAPMIETTLGDDVTVRLDTIDISIDRGNFVRGRVLCSMTFPGAMEGRIGLDLVYQQVPASGQFKKTDAFFVSLNARTDEKFRITDYISFTIKRGSQLTASYADPPVTPGGSRWGFAFDISGGLRLNKRNASGKDVISVGGIDFEHLRFATDGKGLQAPTFTFLGKPITPDSAGTPGGGVSDTSGQGSGERPKIGGFPFGLRSLGLTFSGEGGGMGLSAVVFIALTGEAPPNGGGGPVFGGSAGLALDGLLEPADGRLVWHAPSLRLTSLGIDYRSDALSITGEITFHDDDPTWGTGFGGDLSVTMAKLFNAHATIRFGSRETFRYWFIRGEFTSATPLVVVGPVGVFGFIGGAYQHMTVSEVRDAAGSVTDIRYVPTADATFGIMAGVHIGIAAKPSSFHAKILLTGRFRDAGLTDLSLDGTGWFLCPVERECNGPDDSRVQVRMNFDLAARRFHATLTGRISLKPFLRIDIPDGSVDVLFEPGTWHVYVGRGPFDAPESRTLNGTFIPDLAPVTARTYMMAGDAIDVNIGGIPLRGGGFATGIDVQMEAGGKYTIFYGRVWGRFRAELALIEVDPAASSCIQGQNGWYALASVSLGLGLAVGIDVDLWLVSGRYEIFNAQIAVDMLVGGPHPTFAAGDARGSYSILDGLVSGSFHYHFQVGDQLTDECKQVAMDGMFSMPEPIVSVSPPENKTDVSVFTTIGLGFALREHQEVVVSREGQSVRARFVLETPLNVRAEGSNAVIPGTIAFSADRLSAEWTTGEVLVGRKRHTVTAVAIAQELRSGTWVETRRQVKTWSFTTGDRPRDVYDPNVLGYTYPIKEQRYSYIRGDDGRHYVHLKRNMDYLFTNMAGTQSLVAEYTDKNLGTHVSPLRYIPYAWDCGAFLVVDNPPLEAGMTYHLRLIKRTDPGPRGRLIGSVIDNFDNVMSDYRMINASSTQRAKQVALQSGSDYRRFETGAGSYLVKRKEGNATSRVRKDGRVIDSMMYDWFFAVGAYGSATEKLGAMTVAYRSRSGGAVLFRLTTPEPVDDNLSASLIPRAAPQQSGGGPAAWFDFIARNDKLARDLTTLRSLIGDRDASFARHIVLTSAPRLRIPSRTYIDASAPWNFNSWNLLVHRLRASEMSFEQQGTVAPKGIGGLGIFARASAATGGGLIATTGSGGGAPGDMVVLPFNAQYDFNAMVWRYRNAPYARIRFGPITTQLQKLISASSVNALLAVGNRGWNAQPEGEYDIGLTAKTWRWRHYTPANATAAARQNVLNLDAISAANRTSILDFGEIACGYGTEIPLVRLRLTVPGSIRPPITPTLRR